jgi:hypothetical protein
VAAEGEGMTHKAPPRLLESFLLLFLADRDRETISGDLFEEYCEVQLPRLGSMRANMWYLRQSVSLASVRLWEGSAVKKTLLGLCVFVAASGAWLVLMENVLRHPGYEVRSAVDLCIAAQAIATLLCLLLNGRMLFRVLVLSCALGAAVFGAFSIIRVLRAEHFEGYALVISAALVLQGILTLTTLVSKPARTA